MAVSRSHQRPWESADKINLATRSCDNSTFMQTKQSDPNYTMPLAHVKFVFINFSHIVKHRGRGTGLSRLTVITGCRRSPGGPGHCAVIIVVIKSFCNSNDEQ